MYECPRKTARRRSTASAIGTRGAPGSRVSPRSPAKSTTVVTPPNAAARLAASGGCVMTSGCPAHSSGTGMEICACGSIPPGTTIIPRASMTRPASAASVPGHPTAAIVPPCTPISSVPTPSGVTTCPPLMTRSSMTSLPNDSPGDPQRRRAARRPLPGARLRPVPLPPGSRSLAPACRIAPARRPVREPQNARESHKTPPLRKRSGRHRCDRARQGDRWLHELARSTRRLPIPRGERVTGLGASRGGGRGPPTRSRRLRRRAVQRMDRAERWRGAPARGRGPPPPPPRQAPSPPPSRTWTWRRIIPIIGAPRRAPRPATHSRGSGVAWQGHEHVE